MLNSAMAILQHPKRVVESAVRFGPDLNWHDSLLSHDFHPKREPLKLPSFAQNMQDGLMLNRRVLPDGSTSRVTNIGPQS